jgi:hypothetical protein
VDRDVIHLINILNPFDDWENNGDTQRNLEAKKALYRAYKELLKMKMDRQYKVYRHHTSYLYQLIPLNKALMENKYLTACNELISLFHNEPFLQGRIYNNIIKALRDNLGNKEAANT